VNDSSAFKLHPRLAADCGHIADLNLCRVLLMNDQRFPWCILVPRLAGLRELHELSQADQIRLIREVDHVSWVLAELPATRKINIGALGNLVEQLHVHVVARHPEDAAWPGPVWGSGNAEAYSPLGLRELTGRLAERLAERLASGRDTTARRPPL
jgi:diadenosine tetraphosphate (Ap4A) HIT family hydrolase